MSRPRVWAISDGAAGNARQAFALAARLGEVTQTLALATAAPWRWLAPRQLPLTAHALGAQFARELARDKPDIAVGCGRQAALATRVLRQQGVRAVQILAPRIDSRHWDVVVTPAHDGISGDNVIVTQGSLHAIDDAWLAQARRDWPQFGALPSPRTAVLIGGPTQSVPLAADDWRQLLITLRHWQAKDGGSLLLSGSRRTPDWLRQAARHEVAELFALQWHDPTDGANPYAGLLAWADRLVVSADSVNLLTEACATHAPVYARLPAQPRGRIAAFHQSLLQSGRLTPLADALLGTTQPAQPLREMDAVVADVKARLRL